MNIPMLTQTMVLSLLLWIPFTSLTAQSETQYCGVVYPDNHREVVSEIQGCNEAIGDHLATVIEGFLADNSIAYDPDIQHPTIQLVEYNGDEMTYHWAEVPGISKYMIRHLNLTTGVVVEYVTTSRYYRFDAASFELQLILLSSIESGLSSGINRSAEFIIIDENPIIRDPILSIPQRGGRCACEGLNRTVLRSDTPFATTTDTALDNLQLYPNPANPTDWLYYKNVAPEALKSIRLLNTQGKIVSLYQKPQRPFIRLDQIGLAPGLYFLQFVTHNGMVTRKLVVQ